MTLRPNLRSGLDTEVQMRRWKVSLLAAAVLGAVSVGALVAPADAAPAFDPVPFTVSTSAVKIPGSSSGVVLDGTVYTPMGTKPVAGWPLVVFPASWGTPKQEYEAIARELAAKGYLGVAYTLRGFFDSTGTILAAGTEDQNDLKSLITWSLATYPVDPGKIGTFGVSYGAGIGLLGAGVDPRIKAVVALSGWADLQQSLLPGNTVATEPVQLLETAATGIGKLDPILTDAFAKGKAGEVESLLPLAETRSPGRRIAQINANGAAIMVGNGWQDSLFPSSQWFSTWDKLTGPTKLMLAPGDHAIAEATGITGLPNDYVDAGEAWLDHYLKGVANGADKQGAVLLKPTLGGSTYTALPSLAALTTSTARRYLGTPTGVLSSATSMGTAPTGFSGAFTGGSESSATVGAIMVSGGSYLAGLPPKSVMALVDRSKSLVWQTEKLAAAGTLAGRSTVHATLTPVATKATLVAYLYDVDGSGVGTLLSWQPWTSKALTAGKAAPVDITLEPVFQKVAAGHRLALVIDSVDERYRSETLSGQKIALSGTATSPAYVDLALR